MDLTNVIKTQNGEIQKNSLKSLFETQRKTIQRWEKVGKITILTKF